MADATRASTYTHVHARVHTYIHTHTRIHSHTHARTLTQKQTDKYMHINDVLYAVEMLLDMCLEK